MSKSDTALILFSYLLVSLIIFGVVWWVRGSYSHTLLIVPALVFVVLAAVWMQFREKSR